MRDAAMLDFGPLNAYTGTRARLIAIAPYLCVCVCVRPPPRIPFTAHCTILVEYPPLLLLHYYIYVNIT